MPSNLPPGCNSADGGIDHDLEAAIEVLIDKIPNTAVAVLLTNFVEAVTVAYNTGFSDGAADERIVMEAYLNGQS